MFLLLIFFMVSSTFRSELGMDVSLPQAGSGAPRDVQSHEIVVTRDGELYFSNKRVNEEGLRRELVQLLAKEPDAVLVLRADEAADFGPVVRAIDIARAVGGSHLVIPTRPLKDSR